MRKLVPLVLLLVACGSPSVPAVPAANVSGTVIAAPCRPVERQGDPPCPPVAGVTVEFGSSTAVTDATGSYHLSLPPGTYAIKVKAGDWERPANPSRTTLTAGVTVLNLTYDSGIR